MKFRFLTAVVFILLAGIWFFVRRGSHVQYVTTPVTRGSITSLVEATGTLNPVGNTTVDAATGTVTGGVTVGAQVTGRIMKVDVGFNSRVKKGEVMAEIDPTTYQSDVASAEADLWNAQAAISTAKAQLAKDEANRLNTEKTYERDKVLAAKNYIAPSDLDAAEAAYHAALAQTRADGDLIQSASDNAKYKQAALRKAQTNLSYTRILAPVDGIVIASNAAVGQTVVASFQSPNLFVIAQNLETMQIDTLVDEADVAKIRVGQTARFNVDTYPTKTFKGRVAEIRNNPITQQNVVNYDVIVHVPNPGETFLPGMTANVDFVVAERSHVLEIPNRALLFVPPQTGGAKQGAPASSSPPSETGAPRRGNPRKAAPPRVWVLAGQRPSARNVTLGISDGSQTEVKEGLSEGEEVITGTTEQKAKRNPFSTF